MELTPEIIKQFIEKPFAFVERMGLRAVKLEPGDIQLTVPLKGNENHIGSMYAGALFTIGEIPAGALFLTTFDIEKYYPIVKEMTISFQRPATTDVSIEIKMSEQEIKRITDEVERHNKAEFLLQGEIKNKNGETVAISKGVYQLRAHGT